MIQQNEYDRLKEVLRVFSGSNSKDSFLNAAEHFSRVSAVLIGHHRRRFMSDKEKDSIMRHCAATIITAAETMVSMNMKLNDINELIEWALEGMEKRAIEKIERSKKHLANNPPDGIRIVNGNESKSTAHFSKEQLHHQ